MAEITAQMVKELRDMTGLGMMEMQKSDSEVNRRRHENRRRPAADQEWRQGEQGSRTYVAAEGMVAAYIAPDGRSGAWSK